MKEAPGPRDTSHARKSERVHGRGDGGEQPFSRHTIPGLHRLDRKPTTVSTAKARKFRALSPASVLVFNDALQNTRAVPPRQLRSLGR
jgi:hypothetical protein